MFVKLVNLRIRKADNGWICVINLLLLIKYSFLFVSLKNYLPYIILLLLNYFPLIIGTFFFSFLAGVAFGVEIADMSKSDRCNSGLKETAEHAYFHCHKVYSLWNDINQVIARVNPKQLTQLDVFLSMLLHHGQG